jgi:hypothetical protein
MSIEIKNYLIPDIIIYFVCCSFFDTMLLYSTGPKARWFKLHACYNMFIVGSTISDIYDIILEPNDGFNYRGDYSVGTAVAVLHLYHCLFFNLKPIDYYHHGLSVFFPILLVPNIKYKFTSLYYFNMCGLPGGIEYFCLIFVKQKKLKKKTQKYISSLTNAYIRMPLGIICCCFNYKAVLIETDIIIIMSLITMGLIIYTNVIGFGKLAIENYVENKYLAIKQY